MSKLLKEVTRKEIISAAKNLSPDRFAKSRQYHVGDFKNVNFGSLFTKDEFLWAARVGDHIVCINFNGPFEELKWLVKSMRGPNRYKRLTRQIVQEALSRALDKEDLYVFCGCPDWKYRFNYYATMKDYAYGRQQHVAPKYKKTNMDDEKGYVCKHILSVLYGKRWVPTAAKAWLQYMQANPELTEWYLWNKKLKDDSENDNKPATDKQPEPTKPVEPKTDVNDSDPDFNIEVDDNGSTK